MARSIFLILCLAILAASPVLASAKQVVGATEIIHVQEAGLDFKARIDTGARTTSIHVPWFSIARPARDAKKNIGKKITLEVENAKGERRRIESTIAGVREVRNAQGVETRYVVPLTLVWHGRAKTVEVNLRDRAAMTYKLLIGRDWLRGDYVVDVEKNRE